MFPQYHLIKRIILFLPLVFFFLAINAQGKNEIDSTSFFKQDMDEVLDTVEEASPQDETTDKGYKDKPALNKTIYFSDKHLRSDSGRYESLKTRMLPDSMIKRLHSDNDFWYVNYVFEKGKKEKEEEEKEDIPFTETTVFQTILWLVIIGGFATFIIMYLANSNAGLFRKANKAFVAGEESDIETDNIFEINYGREIDKAVNNGNYRFAVRLMFLRTLKTLSDKKIIQYKQDRTNFDYLLQVHSTKYYNDFFRLNRNYEYSWYGQFDIEPEKYSIIKNDFESFERNLGAR